MPTSAPFQDGYFRCCGPIQRVIGTDVGILLPTPASSCLSAAGLRFLGIPVPAE